ncbi:MAG: hypothetical protein ACI8RE_002098 [Ilumatobacter sp.]
MTPTQEPSTQLGRSSIRRYIPATILVPLIGASLGVVSLPIQIYAARIPIERSRRNVEIFLALAALQAWLLVFLVGIGATGGFATVALGVTITAEISVSVLLATAWQPLLIDETRLDTLRKTYLSLCHASSEIDRLAMRSEYSVQHAT